VLLLLPLLLLLHAAAAAGTTWMEVQRAWLTQWDRKLTLG
jgi:hypothetical protein